MSTRWTFAFLALGITAALAAGTHRAADKGANADLNAIRSLKPTVQAERTTTAINGFPTYFDLSVTANCQYVISQLSAVGITSDLYPALYQALMKAPAIYTYANSHSISLPQAVDTAVGQSLVPINLLQTGASDGTNFSVTAISSVPQNPVAVANTMGLYTQTGDVVTAPQGAIQIGQAATLETTVSAALPQTTTAFNANGVFVYVYPAEVLGQTMMQTLGLKAGDTVAVAGMLDANFAEPEGDTTIVNQQPTNVKGGPYIKVCIARGDADCDYSYAAVNGVFTLQVPLQGNVTFPQSIAFDPVTGLPSQAFYSVAFWFPQVSGGCPMAYTYFASQVHVADNNLSWNIPDATFGNLSPTSGCNVPYGVTQDAVFQITMSVQGTDGTFMPATITSQQGLTTADTLRISPVKVVYGCLPPGTMISLADGATKPIESFHHGDKVKSSRGALTVDNYMTGDERHPLYRVTTQNGFAVRMTEMHPTPTAHGIVLAKNLKQGDVVTTLKGPSPIASIATEAYAGKVWNLDAGLPGEPSWHDVDKETFFADGILVGGSRMQMHYAQMERDSEASILARLPQSWRKDYDSAKARNGGTKPAKGKAHRA